ncbi:AaceriAGR164Cp [[Ashbya] aceris (nom. inval.)]|nr:AaceriAGR164Cp [[Ashbya] aceris (nom. inval.)]
MRRALVMASAWRRAGTAVPRRWYGARGDENPFRAFPSTFPSGEPQWDVDLRRLRREYRQLQSQHHPDVAGGTDEAAQRLNRAYGTLVRPLARAQFLLARNGVDVTSDATAQEIMQRDPGLLMRVLDVHEQLEELESEADVRRLREENRARMAAVEGELGRAFAARDWDRAAQLAVELRYWDNVESAVREWEPGVVPHLKH